MGEGIDVGMGDAAMGKVGVCRATGSAQAVQQSSIAKNNRCVDALKPASQQRRIARSIR